ncbi:MAG: hypothetical protein PHY62_07215 [Gallionella sp.]|nr:hypothetical protein [Gallionella sp.]
MKIKILSIAEDDLEQGHRFYESQADGLGIYFLDTLTLTLTHWPILREYTA